ncbi:MAG: M48 family metallopeptidase [Anaerolineae bacterium]|nr:M48 family metallopeptidase [Anaerolineae bacterium]
MENITLDQNRQKQAKVYAHISRRLMVFDLLIGLLYISLWLVTGWSLALRGTLGALTDNEWLLVAGYALVFGGIFYVINLPLSYFEGFVLPHRFDQSNQSIKDWLVDQGKELLLTVVFGGILVEMIYVFLRAAPDLWWLGAAGFMLVVNVLIANLAPLLLFPLFNKYVPLDEEYAELAQRLIKLAERSGTQVQGVYKFDMSRRTKSANAALAGLGNTRRIILGDTLLKEFSSAEIETVMAHELGHQVHKDIPVGIVISSVLTLLGFYLASLVMRAGVPFFNLPGTADVAAMPLFMLALAAFELVTLPLGNAFSRWREQRADLYALQLTGDGQSYASALTRLANQNLAEVDPEPWVEYLLHSHPALSRRINMALNYQKTGSK